ncbi:MAG: hypothetical protein FWD25_04145 [Clostridia bacterium]|nr:hypothetical protein [Clostridia bacterium]
MKNRLGLLLGCWMVLSLCLSPQLGHVSPQSVEKPVHEIHASREGLYIPPVRATTQLAPALTGTVAVAEGAGATDKEQWASLVIDTPEPDYLALEFEGEYAFVLHGAGEPGAEIELIVNNALQSRRATKVDAQGRWQIGATREDLRPGELYCALRYVHDWGSEITWTSRLSEELPELRLPAYVAEGERWLIGHAQGDVRVEASAEGRSLLCLQNRDGSFSVTGIAGLPTGSEILLTAVDALGNSAEAVCVVVKPDSASLRFTANAPQAHRYLPRVAGVAARDEPTAWPTYVPPTPEPDIEAFFPIEERQELVEVRANADAYATLEGLALLEIDAAVGNGLFNAEVRKRLRDMRRQMVLPVDLSTVGLDGLEIPLVARGHRVGSVWVDSALGTSANTGEETDGFVFTLELEIGESQGRARLQIVQSPEQLAPLKAQGWNPITLNDDTFHDFDEFVEAEGVVLIYACVPLRFDPAEAEPYRRDVLLLSEWRELLPIER